MKTYFKSLIAITTLVLICISSFGQSKLIKYYSDVNQAELSLTQNDFASASTFYDDAFDANEAPFIIDVYNALICAIELKNQKDAYKYCLVLAKRGVGNNFFEKKAMFTELKHTDKHAWEMIIAQSKTNRKKFNKKYKCLNARLKKLYDRDQQMHILLQQRDIKYSEVEVSVKKTDDSISRELMKIFSRWGFLSEFNMGAFVVNDTTLLKEPPFYIIMRHNFQGLSSYDTLFAPICKKSIYEGLLHPMVYAAFRDANPVNGNTYYGTAHHFTRYKCSVFTETEDEHTPKINTVKFIDEQRAIIFIPSLHDALKKILFRIQNPNSQFVIRDNYSRIMDFTNKESEDGFLKYSRIIVEKIPGCQE